MKADKILALYPDAKTFAIEMNLVSSLQKYVEYKSAEDALKANKVKIRELSAIYGEDKISAWIELWLISLAKLMDFEISDEQARLTSMDILGEMYMLNIAEFSLLFSRIKNGNYGIFYGKFNIQTIMQACREYRMERGRILSGLSSEEQNKLNQ